MYSIACKRRYYISAEEVDCQSWLKFFFASIMRLFTGSHWLPASIFSQSRPYHSRPWAPGSPAILANQGISNVLSRVKIPRPPPTLPVKDQFRHILACLVMTSLGGAEGVQIPATHPGLKKIPPYWYPYTTYAKERWLGRELLEVVSTEFRDRSMEYYVRYMPRKCYVYWRLYCRDML